MVTLIRPKRIILEDIQPVSITRFLGLNLMESGDTELKLGEATICNNFRITKGYEAQKMEGHQPLFESLGTGKIQGQWYGKLADEYRHIFNYAGTLYEIIDGEMDDIGTVANAPTNMFYFGTKLYIQDGTNYKSYDGTTLADVTGYAPKIAVNVPPTGGGTLFEQVNLLSGSKRVTFSPTASATVFVLPEASVESIDWVKVNGVAVTTGITKDLTTAKVTFASGQTEGTDTIEIQWTKANATNRAMITKCTQAFLYGGASDTRVFMYGNPDTKNREYFTGVATTPTAEYFPANNYKDIGSSQYAITGMARQYDRQIIFTEKETYYGAIDTFYDATDILITDFPALPINSEKGNIAVGQPRIINNSPISICNDGIYQWLSTTVRDERNAVRISDRVYADLKYLDLSTAKTVDWEEKSELWICVGSKCWIYNYGNDTWYTRDNVKAYNFIVIDGELYFGTDGTINKFGADLRIDNSTEVIDAVYQTGFYAFGAEWLKKNISKLWISGKPESKFEVELSCTIRTARGTETIEIGTATHDIIDFAHMDFEHMTFETDILAKPFRFKAGAKDFAYFMLTLRSRDEIARATILNVILDVTQGGEIK